MTTAASPAAVTAAAPAAISRKRRIAVWFLIVAASLIAVVSILTTWVNRQVFSNASWNEASVKIIDDPKIQAALSAYVVNSLYDNVDVAGQLRQQLPPNLQRVAGPLSSALREPSTRAVGFLLQRPRVRQLWIAANAVAHEKLINVLENKTGNGISTGNGEVTVDVSTLVTQVGEQLGLSPAVLAKLPANAGKITVLRSDQLGAAQSGVKLLHIFSTWLLVAVLFMWGLAIYLARGMRRETLRDVSWSLVLVGLLVLVARRLLGNYAIDALASPPYRDATHALYLIETSVLGDIGRAAILYGVIGALGAALAGPTRIATRIRTWIAPFLNDQPAVVWGAVGFVYLLLVLWGGTHALRVWWGILLLGALLALGVAALRRETLREFPSSSA